MAELPVKYAARNLVTAISKLPISAAIIAGMDSLPPALVRLAINSIEPKSEAQTQYKSLPCSKKRPFPGPRLPVAFSAEGSGRCGRHCVCFAVREENSREPYTLN